MTKLTKFGRAEHVETSKRVMDALKTLGDELGVKFRAAGGLHGSVNGMIKLEVEILDTGNGMSAGENLFKTMASSYGLKPEWFGKSFNDRGTWYQITGFNVGAPKYAVQVMRVHDKKTFKFTAEGVRQGMQRVEAANAVHNAPLKPATQILAA